MRASGFTETVENIFTKNGTTYKAVLRYDESEQKVYDLTLSYVSGIPVAIADPSQVGNTVYMTPIQFFVNIGACLLSGSKAAIVDCVVAVIITAMNDCARLEGEHCWMKN